MKWLAAFLFSVAPVLPACTVNLGQIQDPPRARAVTTTGPWTSMIYAARTDSGVIVIDLGWRGAGGALRRALGDLNAGPEDVVAVFLTHSHRDHIAGWPLLRHARFHLADPEAALFEGEAEHRDLGSRVIEWLLPTRSPRPGELHVHTYGADTSFAFGSDTLRAFPIAGHTAGSAAYLFRGVLFVGDAVSHAPLLGFHAAQRIYSKDVQEDKASLTSLWKRVEPLEVEWVCTAHGKCSRMTEELRRKAVR